MIPERKELELAAVGISISAGCVPCTRYHIKEAVNLGADEMEIRECLSIGVEVADNSLTVIHQRFDSEVRVSARQSLTERPSRQSALTTIGAAVSRNSVDGLKSAITAARELDINDNEIMEVAALAKRIKEKAASHLESILKKLDADPHIASRVANLCT